MPVLLGNRNALREIIESGIDRTALNEALVVAVAQRQPEMVALLLSEGAQLEEALQVLNTIMNHDAYSPAERAVYKIIHDQLMQRMTLREIILGRTSLQDRLIASIQVLPQEIQEFLRARETTRRLRDTNRESIITRCPSSMPTC